MLDFGVEFVLFCALEWRGVGGRGTRDTCLCMYVWQALGALPPWSLAAQSMSGVGCAVVHVLDPPDICNSPTREEQPFGKRFLPSFLLALLPLLTTDGIYYLSITVVFSVPVGVVEDFEESSSGVLSSKLQKRSSNSATTIHLITISSASQKSFPFSGCC